MRLKSRLSFHPIQLPLDLRLTIIPLLALLAMLLRLPFLTWPLTGDEGNYAYTVTWWLRGHPLYVDALGLEKPQGLFLTYALGMKLIGADTSSIRLWGALWYAACVPLVYLISRAILSTKIALLSAAIFTIYTAAPRIEGYVTNAETFMIFFLLLSALSLLKAKFGHAGAFASAALLYKASALAGFLLAMYWLLETRRDYSAWLRFSLASIPLPLIALAHGALTAGLGNYLYNVVAFRLLTGWQTIENPALAAVVGWYNTMGVWLPLCLLSLPFLKHFGDRNCRFIVFWVLMSVFGVAMGGEWTPHYFIQLTPSLSAAAAAGLHELWNSRSTLIRIEAAFVIVAFYVITQVGLYTAGAKAGSWMMYQRLGLKVADEAADYIKRTTRPTDEIYVAFYQANIYYLSDRKSVVPYLSRIQLLFFPGAYDRLLEAIEERRPQVVLLLNQEVGHLEKERFKRVLEAGYTPERTFSEAILYRRK